MKKKKSSNRKVYLFVNSFKWTNGSDAIRMAGHLLPNKVYKAEEVMVGADTSYRIDLNFPNREDGIWLTELVGEFVNWTCDIEIVPEDSSILDMDISDEDMEMMSQGFSHTTDEDSDLIWEVEEEDEGVLVKVEEPKGEKDNPKIPDHVIVQIGKSLNLLMNKDQDAFLSMALVIHTFSSIILDDDYISILDALTNNKSDLAARLSGITVATSQLEAHLNSKDNSPDFLLNAMYAIVMEIKRTTIIKHQ